MKQTAVEWLMNEAMKLVVQYMQGTLNYDTLDDVIYELGTKSKEMEKEQIMDAYNEGQNTPYEYSESNDVNWYDGKQYYNETFKLE